LSGSGC